MSQPYAKEPNTATSPANIIAAIRHTLQVRVPDASLARFGEQARLNEDLALDSIMLLQLFVHLELDHGLTVPEDAIIGEDLATVGDLVRLLRYWQGREAS